MAKPSPQNGAPPIMFVGFNPPLTKNYMHHKPQWNWSSLHPTLLTTWGTTLHLSGAAPSPGLRVGQLAELLRSDGLRRLRGHQAEDDAQGGAEAQQGRGPGALDCYGASWCLYDNIYI